MTRSLILADVDGTLVDAAGHLWHETYGIISAAEASSATVALCSARPAWSVRLLADRLGTGVHYAVSFQGAMVSSRMAFSGIESPDHWKTVQRCVLDLAVAPSIQTLIRPEDSLWYYTETDWRIRSVNDAAELEAKVIGATWTSVGLSGNEDPLLKILIVRAEQPEVLLVKLMSASLPITCSISQPGYIEVVSDTVDGDKGAGVLRELERCCGTLPHTVAIGDGRNDLGMLAAADIAITFEDAASDVREAADLILPADRPSALRELSKLILEDSL